MSPLYALKSAYRDMFDIKGRTSRAPYFWFLFFWRIVIGWALGFSLYFGGLNIEDPRLADMLTSGFYHGLGLLVIAWPALTMTIRRLHDSNHSGFWILSYIPPALVINGYPLALLIIYTFIELWWGFLKPTEGDNSFGPDPRTTASQ